MDSEDIRRNNRLSGFLTSLVHRNVRPATADKPQSTPDIPSPARPITPPPSLPPPSLHELGLSLSVITSDLAPSHFSTPPSSGAFLAPNYLLLCHAQGLDVLPLVSPPASQPYALVRRVCFKSVVVMEQRGVLVAIAGRRDGVRVYALEEVKKVIEWRIDVEIRRERERLRRENLRRPVDERDSQEKLRKTSLSTPPPTNLKGKLAHKGSFQDIPVPAIPPSPLVPRTPTTRPDPQPDHPPPYISPDQRPPRPRTNSVADMLTTAPMSRRPTNSGPDSKADWEQSSEDEAIDIVAAGTSGSQALDERTSATLTTPPAIPTPRRRRPANLDLSHSNTATPSEPSPAPTLLTLRQALSHSPEQTPVEPDEDDEDINGQISLAQALMESRLPDLPPLGSRRPQQPILIVSSHPVATGEEEPASPRTSESAHPVSPEPRTAVTPRRRRWSVLIGQSPTAEPSPPLTAPATRERSSNRLSRSYSYRSNQSVITIRPSSSENITSPTSPPSSAPPIPETTLRSSRFIPRIISTALHTRRSEDRSLSSANESDASKKINAAPLNSHFPPPKLEYVKLPGTKGSLMIKAVETARKSFLAILCGEHGEKVELFAGTYRTALGLSRTFILPDSPRSLELQLQGDDLVEVFLVFPQNVFGLEPATVRVREVRIGRAERRAARRRIREIRNGDNNNDSEPQLVEEDTNVNVSIGVTVSVGSTVVATGTGPTGGQQTPLLVPSDHPEQPTPDPNADLSTDLDGNAERPSTPPDPSSALAHAEELVAIATAQMGPYTTFQQLSFAPAFPLASIADEYIIPPTYPEFLEYRMEHEPETGSGIITDLAQVQFTPPGLPVPPQTTPSRWFYRDPKNVVHGPWKASLMQAWYKDGLLPPDLPVRREEDSEYMPLKDLRQQSVDPTHPFRSAPPPSELREAQKPLLRPISLLEQPRHYGPPALFYSSRGGHSTAIVDSRGRSVLKGRFLWSGDDQEGDYKAPFGKMGDVRRLEAFDVKDRSILVAMRQGGLEAVDLGDALLKPGDESRTSLPHFNPPPSNLNRRAPFVWKIGTPVASSSNSATVLSSKHKGHYITGKKMSTSSARSPSKPEFNIGDDVDSRDEVLFLGRKDDEIYICERNHGAFRILRLGLESR